jgi:hypothetical protein
VRRDEILLQQKFHRIGDRLPESTKEWRKVVFKAEQGNGKSDAVRPQAILD